jgi:cation:H+ antiporter
MVITLLWVLALVAGLSVSAIASGRALHAAQSLGQRAGLSPFVIGLTIVAIGADLPEIANSISAAYSGHGDLNVGDSTGSAATQITLVLALLCFMRPVRTEHGLVMVGGLSAVVALLVAAAVMGDGWISRSDGLLLVGGWIVSTGLIGFTTNVHASRQLTLFTRGAGRDLGAAIFALSIVAGGAVIVVMAFVAITEDLGVPEYITSFFVLSIGTSLPELLVDGRALREGSGSLALGGIVGSSLVDSTLSLGIGPALFPVAVSDKAASGTLVVAAIIAVALVILISRRVHGWRSGVALLGVYAALYPLLLIVE